MKQTNNLKKKSFTVQLLLAVLILFIHGCTKADINFGNQFVDNDYTQIVNVDTITVELTTRLYDSVQTSGSGKGVLGIYNDPAFGLVKASSYLKLRPPQYYDDSNYNNTIFDSLVIVLKPNKTYYGDTTKPLHIDVYRLIKSIEPAGNNTVLYNTNTISRYTTPLGSKDILLYPSRADSISIRLSDDLGQGLLDLLKSKNQYIQDADNFLTYFKGVCIAASGNPACVFGFDDSISMRLFYKVPGIIKTQAMKEFLFNDSVNQFNNISIDRSGTPLYGVTANVHSLVSSKLTAMPVTCNLPQVLP